MWLRKLKKKRDENMKQGEKFQCLHIHLFIHVFTSVKMCTFSRDFFFVFGFHAEHGAMDRKFCKKKTFKNKKSKTTQIL